MRHLLLILSGLLLTTCFDPAGSTDSLSEGIIDYRITYFDSPESNPIISTLPNTLQLCFKKNNTKITLNGYLNFFGFSYLTMYKPRESYTILRIVDKNYVNQSEFGKQAYGYEDLSRYIVKYTERTKQILGYTCKEVIYIEPENKERRIHIYYTDEINIKNPNINNPFKKVDGVLLEFEVVLNGIKMRFEATNICGKQVADNEFVLPKKYSLVEDAELDHIIRGFLPPIEENKRQRVHPPRHK